jgi:AraC-like DNA-binding protein
MLMFIVNGMVAQPVCNITSYYKTSSNEPLHHICGILQDKSGMIWITSWGGMFSFDGTKFIIHEEQRTKSISIAPGHVRGIEACPAGGTWHLMGKPKEAFTTDRFGTLWHLTDKGRLYYRSKNGEEVACDDAAPLEGYRGCFADRQGNWWVVCYYALHKIVFDRQRMMPMAGCEGQRVRCIHRFHDGTLWLCQRLNPKILVYGPDNVFRGYLSATGRVETRPSDFLAPVYSLHTSANGDIWVGTKGQGAYRLLPANDESYKVEHVECLAPQSDDVYSITSDNHGRVWLATLNGGLLCVSKESQDTHRPKADRIAAYDYDHVPRLHSLYMFNDTLIAGGSEGLVVANIDVASVKDASFRLHQYDKDNDSSLSSNLVDYVIVDDSGQLIVCTENGGICVCTSPSLFDSKLRFERIDNKNGLSDVAFAIKQHGDSYWVTSLYTLSLIKKNRETNKWQILRFGQEYFGGSLRLDEIPPMQLSQDKWLLSTSEGAMVFDTHDIEDKGYMPPIVLTKCSVGDGKDRVYTEIPDTIVLESSQRFFSIEFSALDYSNPEGIRYFFRLPDNDTTWTSISGNMLSFADIKPGMHRLEVCSTNGQGAWVGNTIRILIEVKPRFSETIWALLLFVTLIVLFAVGVLYTVVYVRRIKKKHNDVRTAYLSLIGKQETVDTAIRNGVTATANDDDFITRLTEYINQNLSNPNLRAEMMADHMSVSVSTLIRNTKSQMGVTPGEFLSKARIRKAEIILVQQKHLTISEVAFKCGFNDPKYFSRCFKNETNMSPTEFRSQK